MPSIGGAAGWAVICEKVKIRNLPIAPYAAGAPREGCHLDDALRSGKSRAIPMIFSTAASPLTATRLARRIGEDVARLFDSGGRVQGHHHCAHSERGLVDHHPARTVIREDRDSIAMLQSKSEQAGAQAGGFIGNVVPGVVLPGLAVLVPQEGSVAEPFSLRVKELGQSREIVHPLDLPAILLTIALTIAKRDSAPNLPAATLRHASGGPANRTKVQLRARDFYVEIIRAGDKCPI